MKTRGDDDHAIFTVAIHLSRGCRQQLPTKLDLVGAKTVGEQAVMANTMKAVWQHVE